jgi:hypothetical protein
MQARVIQAMVVVGIVYVAGAGCGGGNGPDEPTPVCSIAIAPGSLAFGSDGGNGSVTVTTPANCPWTATTGDSWITVTAGTNRSGPGTLAYTVGQNASTDVRSGKVTIGDQTHAVTQQGRAPTACRYQLSPDTSTWGNDGGSRTFDVITTSDCAWTAVSNAPWIVVNSGQGSGNGSVSYTVARNTEIVDRSNTITVADRTFTVRQGGDFSACQYSVSPVDFTPCMPGGNAVASVTTQASCPWTATPDASWLGVPTGSSGTGSGVITITFPDNYDAPRLGVVKVRWPTPTAGQNIRVAQAGCMYGVSRSTFNFAAGGGAGTFDVLQQSDPIACGGATQDRCVWSAQSNVSWITITSSMPRAGDNPVSFTVAANTTGAAREGRITVRDKVVVITQTP